MAKEDKEEKKGRKELKEEDKTQNVVSEIEAELIPNHTRKESILIISAVFFGVLSFVFLKNIGIKFVDFLTPITSFERIMSGETTINFLFLILGLFFLSVSLSSTILFSLIKEKRKLFLFIIPPITGIASMFFFDVIMGCGILLSYFIIEYLVSKDRDIFKKISINYLVNHSVSKAMFLINIAISLAVLLALLNNSSYAEKELNSIMTENIGEDIQINNLKDKLIEQQKNSTMIFANSIVDSIDSAFSEVPMCRNALIENRQSINDQVSEQVDRQLNLQEDKFDKVQQMAELIVTFYPYLTAITLFAVLQLFNTVVMFLAKTSTLLFYRFLRKAIGFSISS